MLGCHLWNRRHQRHDHIREHPLAWRWTDPKYAELPSNVLAQITPIDASAAAGVYLRHRRRRVYSRGSFNWAGVRLASHARGGHQPASHSVVASRMRSAYDLGDFHPMVGRLLLSVRRCVYRSGCAAVAPRVPPREWVQFLSRSPGLTAPSSRLELWRTDFGGRVASCLKAEETKNGAARGRC
jgi:hypothetical protein